MEAASLAAKPRSADPTPAGSPGLKKGAISYLSNVVIGVASTAPGYSLAATIGFIVGTAGISTHMPAVIVVSFIPMFFVAMAYKNMNAADPDCGTTFSWVTRGMGPSIGWIAGWTILVSDIVVNANQAQIAGSYGFQLVGLNSASGSTTDIILLGGVFIVILTWICW
ncbi:MAG TPA: amino acid transporter, partial [Candidatus Limnocylindria bacterium]|nr:amino acid transporter [Candidatus Limnocylindria bacterium]